MRVRASDPLCGTYYRFTNPLATHPRNVVLMRIDYEQAIMIDLATGEEWAVTRTFFEAHYERTR